MSKRAQVKPLSAYKELTESKRRLVNKLIIGLHADTIDEDTRLNINRVINRSRRDPSDTGKRYTNGYLVFYKERFVQLKKTDKDKPVTEIAKQLGAEWKSLSDDEKAVYNKQAAEQR
jgi:hypothetical protein